MKNDASQVVRVRLHVPPLHMHLYQAIVVQVAVSAGFGQLALYLLSVERLRSNYTTTSVVLPE